MLYQAYEFTHAAVTPLRNAANYSRKVLTDPLNPWRDLPSTKAFSAALEIFWNATKRYGKPEFGIDTITTAAGEDVGIVEEISWSLPFADLLHFKKVGTAEEAAGPKVLIVAPMSGHYATLLRGTVKAMLPQHDVYITDWRDARLVPSSEGRFGLAEYVDYLIEFINHMGCGVHVMGVCQPGVPLMVAASVMAAEGMDTAPASMILMGSPIDARVSPTQPTILAETHPLSWFESNVISHVPWPHPGFGRRVYPGFLQLTGFMSMNLDRHMDAYLKQFDNLCKGDGESVAAHRAFYDEYLSVMDLTAEFYLETMDRVFQRHLLPKGEFIHRGKVVRPELIQHTALMTIEGGRDDITGAGQTKAAHDLCTGLSEAQRLHFTHPDVGHYGVFNGHRWRTEIQPKVHEFIKTHTKA